MSNPQSGKKKRIKRFVILAGLVTTLFPIVQVIVVGLVDPPTTGPRIVRRIGGLFKSCEYKPNEFRWLDLGNSNSNFLVCALASEDRRFFEHSGFDWKEIRGAWDESKETGKPARGASTITQQCARSLFLWQGRSWIRKGLEAYYTFWMELILSKRRILELYVNVIEFGDGIYGIEAAAHHYYKVPASQLTHEQAAMLVAIMPSPKKWDPFNPSDRVLSRQKRILENQENYTLPETLMK